MVSKHHLSILRKSHKVPIKNHMSFRSYAKNHKGRGCLGFKTSPVYFEEFQEEFIFSEDADGETRTRNPSVINRVL